MNRYVYEWMVTFANGSKTIIEEETRKAAMIRANVIYSEKNGRVRRIHRLPTMAQSTVEFVTAAEQATK